MQLRIATFGRPNRRRSMVLPLLPYVLPLIAVLYLVLPGLTLLILGWHYVGGGAAIQKLHPATYLLLVGLGLSLVFDQQLRRLFVHRFASDPSLVLFLAAVLLTAAYSYFTADTSIAPFVDTFGAAIVSAVVFTCISNRQIKFTRQLVDAFFIVNIFFIFFELIQQTDFLMDYVNTLSLTPEEAAILGAQGGGSFFGRLSALFGHPLNAAMLFGIYSIANLVSTPMRFSPACAARLSLSILSYLAIFPTGSRASLVMTTIILLLYLISSTTGSISRGYLNQAGTIYVLVVGAALVLLGAFLWSVGFFDPMLDRFEHDAGSALSRDFALELLQNASTFTLWFGFTQSDLYELQQSFGLIAIEIAWVNFVLVGGLVTTIPLFITFCLFLFRSLRKYCDVGIYFVSLLIFESTFASNSIWSKGSALTSSLIVGISFLRRSDLLLKVHPKQTMMPVRRLDRAIFAN
jgi:hypothetical protein